MSIGKGITGARRVAAATLAVGALWTFMGQAAGPSVPLLLTEQGRLTDAKDNPITASTKLTFNLYATATGGTSSWSETQTVTPDEGYFSVELGSMTPLPTFSGAELYLGVTVGSDAEMTPRQAITSVPYALVANNAIGDITPNSVTATGAITSGGFSVSGSWDGNPVVVSSTTAQYVRQYFLYSTSGLTVCRVWISVNGLSAGGAGQATVLFNATSELSQALPAAGDRPDTYVSTAFTPAVDSTIDVSVSATTATSPVLVRDVQLVCN